MTEKREEDIVFAPRDNDEGYQHYLDSLRYYKIEITAVVHTLEDLLPELENEIKFMNHELKDVKIKFEELGKTYSFNKKSKEE